jgi:hypothetical protein
MATQVHSDDPEITRERFEDIPPVQLGRERDSVDKHERPRAARPRALPHPRDTTAWQLHQFGYSGQPLS